jgi:uncharacterized protein YggE
MKRAAIVLTATLLLTGSALAQPAPGNTLPAPRYDLAPWWMRDSIIASSGFAEVEVPSNRANFSAQFQVVDRDVATATRLASEKIKALGGVLSSYGAEKVRIETSFSTRPLFDQYRDKEGNLVENQRADKIERYEVTANVRIEVRDLRLIERVYATVLSAKPSSSGAVGFSLDADNETKTQIYADAVKDANRRARLSVAAAGGSIGAVKLIDPTGRACETDVLVAGADRSGTDQPAYESYPAPAPPMMASMDMIAVRKAETGAGLTPDQFMLPLQPPAQKLTATACVIYALTP